MVITKNEEKMQAWGLEESLLCPLSLTAISNDSSVPRFGFWLENVSPESSVLERYRYGLD